MQITFSRTPSGTPLSILILALFLGNGLSISSSAQSQTPSKVQTISSPKSAKVSDIVIQGQVFIVTNGGSNIKLALVGVSAYSEKDLISQFGKTLEAEQGDREKAFMAMQEAKNELVAAEERLSVSDREQVSAFEVMKKNYENKELRAANFAALKARADAGNARYDASTIYSNKKTLFESQTAPRHLIEKLGVAKFTTKSDADGNFDLSLPAGSYALVATAKRQAGSSIEFYDWIVRVEAKSNKKIMLSNDNLAESQCGACIAVPSPK